MFRRSRGAHRAPEPDPALMRLVETTGAAARSCATFRDAVSRVVEDVAYASGWTAGHAWVPGDVAGEWVSLGVWHPDDGMRLGGLREACVDGAPAAVRGHLALALHLEATHWACDLGAIRGTRRYEAATAAGIVSAVACPVYSDGRPIALLEWYLSSGERPPPDVSHVLGHLSGVLSEVAERPAPTPVPAPRAPLRETLRWVTEDGVLSRLLTC